MNNLTFLDKELYFYCVETKLHWQRCRWQLTLAVDLKHFYRATISCFTMLINSNLARYCCILYICLIRVDLSCGVTIRQRFKMEQLRNVAIRITIPDVMYFSSSTIHLINTIFVEQEPVLSLNPKTSHINRAGHEVYLTFRAMLGVFK